MLISRLSCGALFAAFAALCVVSPARDVAAEPMRLSLPQAIERARQRAPELVLADMQTALEEVICHD